MEGCTPYDFAVRKVSMLKIQIFFIYLKCYSTYLKKWFIAIVKFLGYLRFAVKIVIFYCHRNGSGSIDQKWMDQIKPIDQNSSDTCPKRLVQ